MSHLTPEVRDRMLRFLGDLRPDPSPERLGLTFARDPLDDVLHLGQRDPIRLMLLAALSGANHLAPIGDRLVPKRLTLDHLAGQRLCPICMPTSSMVYEALDDFDLANAAVSITHADAMVDLDTFALANAVTATVANGVSVGVDQYVVALGRLEDEIAHLALPDDPDLSRLVLDAFERARTRLATFATTVFGSAAVRDELSRRAAELGRYVDGDEQVTVVIQRLVDGSVYTQTTPQPVAVSHRLATDLALAYGPASFESASPVRLPRWAARLVAEELGADHIGSDVHLLDDVQFDTASKLWSPDTVDVYRDFDTCAYAAQQLHP